MDEPKPEPISEARALVLLRARITYHTTAKDLAEKFGMSASNMSAILGGNRPIPDNVLQSLGYVRETIMVPIVTAADTATNAQDHNND